MAASSSAAVDTIDNVKAKIEGIKAELVTLRSKVSEKVKEKQQLEEQLKDMKAALPKAKAKAKGKSKASSSKDEIKTVDDVQAVLDAKHADYKQRLRVLNKQARDAETKSNIEKAILNHPDGEARMKDEIAYFDRKVETLEKLSRGGTVEVTDKMVIAELKKQDEIERFRKISEAKMAALRQDIDDGKKFDFMAAMMNREPVDDINKDLLGLLVDDGDKKGTGSTFEIEIKDYQDKRIVTRPSRTKVKLK